ncbi:DUF3180 domain-containing protein [Microbacterium thalassium]|uniref:DUF3180 domain-containing protein n=1 Tax=Microbacterium thalassium TaxID=362649 RepID=A0A7X0FLW1_9MICO|nr:DUF3180 domain-containing protein [Microbacterium thalassium]MBB6389907.1 hypothetical protein [Microbacterium thalassium]GLK24594.1 hypothetical protein GCM10017607_19120 [Microbacterium thalassium]
MKRTGPGVLIVAAVIGVAAGYALDQILTAAGRPTFTPAITLPVLLIALGAAVVSLAWPIHRAARGSAPARIDPFRAVRIAMLAKASSIVGAGVGGLGLGLALFLLSRPVPPSVGSIAAVLATAAAGGVLIAAALVAEHLCTIRKDDDDEQPGGAGTGPEPQLHD